MSINDLRWMGSTELLMKMAESSKARKTYPGKNEPIAPNCGVRSYVLDNRLFIKVISPPIDFLGEGKLLRLEATCSEVRRIVIILFIVFFLAFLFALNFICLKFVESVSLLSLALHRLDLNLRYLLIVS